MSDDLAIVLEANVGSQNASGLFGCDRIHLDSRYISCGDREHGRG